MLAGAVLALLLPLASATLLLDVAGGFWCLVSPITSTVSLTLFVGAMLAFQGLMELAPSPL